MRYKADIKGSIIPNDYKDYYDWLGVDATCPKDIADVLAKLSPGDYLDVYINSPGGVIESGSEIYTLLREASVSYDVKLYITGEACSAASVIACAAYCEMSPTALMMVHCVSTQITGNHNDAQHMVEVLQSADKAMCQAYMAKTGMSEEDALDMMEHETWLTAQQAVDKGLVDAIMFDEEATVPMVAGPLFRLPTREQMEQFRVMTGTDTHDITHAKAQANLDRMRLMNI